MADNLGNPLRCQVPQNPVPNSAQCMLCRVAGYIRDKEITLNLNNTSGFVNLFVLTGSVEITSIFAQVTEKTTLANLTEAYLDVYDGTVAIDITENGAVLSGANVGSYFLKSGSTAEVAAVALNSQVRLIETVDAKKLHHPFVITQKKDVATYIRFHYKTTDAPINAKMKFYAQFGKINGGTVEPV